MKTNDLFGIKNAMLPLDCCNKGSLKWNLYYPKSLKFHISFQKIGLTSNFGKVIESPSKNCTKMDQKADFPKILFSILALD